MRLGAGQVAVVTGAGGGIGRAISVALAQRGCDLALVDRDAAGLQQTQSLIQPTGRTLSLHVVDVSQRPAMARLPQAVIEAHGGVHLLVNNAGVSLAGPLEQLAPEDMEWIVGVNFWGVVSGCQLFLAHLRRQPEAHIVNILSDFALIGFPTKSAYCATKFAVRGFSEALRAELHGSGIGLTCVYPGPADTHLVRGGRAWDAAKNALEAQFLKERGIPLERIAAGVVRGIERNAARVLIGRETVAIDLMSRLFPAWTNTLMARMQKRLPFV
jgi:short-subunit dehydrogenase